MRSWNKINLESKNFIDIIKIERLECTELDCTYEVEFHMSYILNNSGSINTLYVCRYHLLKYIKGGE